MAALLFAAVASACVNEDTKSLGVGARLVRPRVAKVKANSRLSLTAVAIFRLWTRTRTRTRTRKLRTFGGDSFDVFEGLAGGLS